MKLKSNEKLKPRGALLIVAGELPLEVGEEVAEIVQVILIVHVFVQPSGHWFKRKGSRKRFVSVLQTNNEALFDNLTFVEWIVLFRLAVTELLVGLVHANKEAMDGGHQGVVLVVSVQVVVGKVVQYCAERENSIVGCLIGPSVSNSLLLSDNPREDMFGFRVTFYLGEVKRSGRFGKNESEEEPG